MGHVHSRDRCFRLRFTPCPTGSMTSASCLRSGSPASQPRLCVGRGSTLDTFHGLCCDCVGGSVAPLPGSFAACSPRLWRTRCLGPCRPHASPRSRLVHGLSAGRSCRLTLLLRLVHSCELQRPTRLLMPLTTPMRDFLRFGSSRAVSHALQMIGLNPAWAVLMRIVHLLVGHVHLGYLRPRLV